MIYKILETQEVITLKDELEQGLPGTAKIYYVLRNFLKNLFEGFEVIVDQWPVWTCIVLRAGQPDRAPVYFRSYYICHARSVSALKFFIQRPGVIDWDKEATFTGVPCDLVPFLKELCRKRNAQLKNVQPRFMYAWSKAELPEKPKIPDGFQLTTLQEEHALILRRDWKNMKVDTGLDAYFKNVITNFANSALVDKDGRLVAYICMQYNGSMAMLSGAPEDHGMGYGQIVLNDLTRKLLKDKEIAYGFIPCKDSSSIDIIRNMGYAWVPQGNMTWFRFDPTPASISPVNQGTTQVLERSQSQDESCSNCMFINAIPLVVKDLKDSSVLCKVGTS